MELIDEGCGRTPKTKKGKEKKFKKVMDKWEEGKLHSGSKKGPKVPKSKQDQALAIAFSEAGESKNENESFPSEAKFVRESLYENIDAEEDDESSTDIKDYDDYNDITYKA